MQIIGRKANIILFYIYSCFVNAFISLLLEFQYDSSLVMLKIKQMFFISNSSECEIEKVAKKHVYRDGM